MSAEAISRPVVITEPGVYDGMNEETYHSDPVPGGSLSSTMARRILPPNVPAILRYEMDHPRTPTMSMQFGSGAHRVILGAGPELLNVGKQLDGRTKAGMAQKQRWQDALAAGLQPVYADDFEHMTAMAGELRKHPLAAALFDPDAGKPEQSLFWQEPIDFEEPIWCRSRIDFLPDAVNDRIIFGDYKSADRLDDDSIRKAVGKYRYDQQIDFYERSVIELGLAATATGVLVMQMKTPPYLVRVVTFDTETRRIARARNERAITTYAECKRTDTWPGYGDNLHTTSLPAWTAIQDETEFNL